MGSTVKGSTPLVLDLVLSSRFKPSTLVNADLNFQKLILEYFPQFFVWKNPNIIQPLRYEYVCVCVPYSRSIFLSRCYVIKGSYFKLLNHVFKYNMNICFTTAKY